MRVFDFLAELIVLLFSRDVVIYIPCEFNEAHNNIVQEESIIFHKVLFWNQEKVHHILCEMGATYDCVQMQYKFPTRSSYFKNVPKLIGLLI